VSVYHLLIENKVIHEPAQCQISAPGSGCGTKWINEFGYITIPALALTGFALALAFLLFAVFEPRTTATEGPTTALASRLP